MKGDFNSLASADKPCCRELACTCLYSCLASVALNLSLELMANRNSKLLLGIASIG